MITSLDELVPTARAATEKMLSALDVQGISYFISETYRTVETQRAYYAQGRQPLPEVNRLRRLAGLRAIAETDNHGIITRCDGDALPSPHQSGRAIDIYPVIGKWVQWSPRNGNLDIWRAMGEAGELAGFTWGGRWAPFDRNGIGWDAPHYQVPA